MLDKYLEEQVPGYRGPGQLTPFEEGQSNPTFLLEAASGRYVLRRKPEGALLKSAHAIEREYRVQEALADQGVPVARMRHLCEDSAIIGTPFYVMDHLDGRVLRDPALPDQPPAERAEIYAAMAQALAAIHSVDLTKAGLMDYGKHEGFYDRQLALWTRQYEASITRDIPEMAWLHDWLTERLPPADLPVTLIHGDYRIDNLMFAKGSATLMAVFDWELSTLGDPLSDLAYQVMQRDMARDWHLKGLVGIDLAESGLPTADQYVESYCTARNIAVPEHWGFALVFAFYRFAAICQGVGKRAEQGNSASPSAHKVGQMAAPLAALGKAKALAL